jgi:histidinol-phosphate phosphatase family protein
LNRAIFLDRDGVINEDRDDYVKSWEEVHFIKGARQAIKMIHQAGIPIIVITNQAAIGRGIISEADLSDIHTRMQGAIKKGGGSISHFYYCPHHPDDQCHCRKPRCGLLKRAARDLNLNLADCFFVGDTLKDVHAGRRAGCRTVLVQTGQGEKTLQKILAGQTTITPDWVCEDLASATPLMLNYFKNEVLNSKTH